MDASTFQAEAMRLEKLMYHVSWSMLHHPEDCADAVQETLARAWQKRHTLHQTAAFKPWIMRILVNQCSDMLRKRKWQSPTPVEQLPLQASPVQPSPLQECIQHMQPELRLVMVLHYLEGFTVEETARIARIPAGTVKSRLKRGREQLSTLLQQEREEEPCHE